MKVPFRRKIWAYCLSSFFFLTFPPSILTTASAAVINYGADSQHRGYLTLSGSIEPGDGIRFNSIIKILLTMVFIQSIYTSTLLGGI